MLSSFICLHENIIINRCIHLCPTALGYSTLHKHCIKSSSKVNCVVERVSSAERSSTVCRTFASSSTGKWKKFSHLGLVLNHYINVGTVKQRILHFQVFFNPETITTSCFMNICPKALNLSKDLGMKYYVASHLKHVQRPWTAFQKNLRLNHTVTLAQWDTSTMGKQRKASFHIYFT